jgi:peptidoglycan DL-endopeptidase CwlO
MLVPAALLRRTLTAAGLAAALAVPLGVPLAVPAAAAPARSSAAATSRPGADPTLRYGARGSAVVTLQHLLGVTPATGFFGPLTRRAVLQFQASQHLLPDGVVGEGTWQALRTEAHARLVRRVLAEAARHVGQPYRYGANGPDAFDCSGFVQYVFARAGIRLPRTAREQAAFAAPVAWAARQPGDLVIFSRGGRAYHVGIYAGDDSMWVARHTGTTITRQRLWTTRYSVGRFG